MFYAKYTCMNKVADLALAISEVDKDPSKELTVDVSGYSTICFSFSFTDNKTDVYILGFRKRGGEDEVGIKISRDIAVESKGKEVSVSADRLTRSVMVMVWNVSVAKIRYKKVLKRIEVYLT